MGTILHNANVELRLCKVCHEHKAVSKFRVGHGGRLKSICDGCTEAIISAALGDGIRRCATCGRLTANYRCSACWRTIRGDSDSNGLDPNYLP